MQIKKFQPIQIIITCTAIAFIAFSSGYGFAHNKYGRPNVTIIGNNENQTDNLGNEPVKIKGIDEVWQELRTSYYDATKLDSTKLRYGAIRGFVSALDDPYTVFMTPEESKEFADGLEGQLEGIGAALEIKDKNLIVVSTIKDSPAARAGLLSGDIIYEIDGKIAAEMTFYQAVYSIRGKKGTPVTLTIVRENLPEPKKIPIIRGEITIDSVELKKLDNDIFHLSIHQFNDHSKKEFEDAVQKILLEKTQGIILDVRSNGGGYMEASINMLSEFIAGEKVVVITKKRDGSQNEFMKTSGTARLGDIPMVVLINGGSASASEIVAGALQDYKRAILIGEKTFGKGSVQELHEFPDGSRLRMTVAEWLTPLERSIDKVGIPPDIEVKLSEEDRVAERDPQLNEAIRYLKKPQKK